MNKELLQLTLNTVEELQYASTDKAMKMCAVVIPALKAEIAKSAVTHITWSAEGVRTVNGVPDYAAQPAQSSVKMVTPYITQAHFDRAFPDVPIALQVQSSVSHADFVESVGLMFAAIGYTEEYARQCPKEKVSVTFKRWLNEQIENAKLAQPVQPVTADLEAKLAAAEKQIAELIRRWV